MLNQHVLNRFPDLAEAIRSLMKKDLGFRETCADYEEICTWLASHARPDGCPPEDRERNLELKRNLEREIEEALLRKHAQCEALQRGSKDE